MLKILLPVLAMTLLTASYANAAFTSCAFTNLACDQFGNHYYCKVVGWTGPKPPRYCSPTDQTSKPARVQPTAPTAETSRALDSST